MVVGINTNLTSLGAQNKLNQAQNGANQALERLSSGLRINSAKDDAAGLAISTRFQSQISGLQVARRNASDGISLSQTAEGALNEITTNLQRIRDLSVQAANATNSPSDREALNQEVQQRLDEADRIASQTAFNGLNVLDGTLGDKSFQVGANAGEVVNLDLSGSARTESIGAVASLKATDLSATFGAATPASTGEISFNNVSNMFATSNPDATYGVQLTDVDGNVLLSGLSDWPNNRTTRLSSENVASAIADMGFTGDGATVDGFTITLDEGSGFSIPSTIAPQDITNAVDHGTITFTRADGKNFIFEEAVDGTYSNGPAFTDVNTKTSALPGASEGVAAVGGGVATIGAGDFTVKIGNGEAVDLEGVYESEQDLADVINSRVSGAFAQVDDNGALTIDAVDDITLGGTDTTLLNAFGSVDASTGEVSARATSGSLDDVNVGTVDGANDAILRIDSALQRVNDQRGHLGAVQNRLESTFRNLSNSVENLSASNSRILDADFALETAKLAKFQVLQQAGISVLAQANARPQQVLSLLQ